METWLEWSYYNFRYHKIEEDQLSPPHKDDINEYFGLVGYKFTGESFYLNFSSDQLDDSAAQDRCWVSAVEKIVNSSISENTQAAGMRQESNSFIGTIEENMKILQFFE